MIYMEFGPPKYVIRKEGEEIVVNDPTLIFKPGYSLWRVPDEVKIAVFYYKKAWRSTVRKVMGVLRKTMLKMMLGDFNEKDPEFLKIAEEKIIINYFPSLDEIDPNDWTAAVCFIPPEKSFEDEYWAEPKRTLLERGLASQMITHDPEGYRKGAVTTSKIIRRRAIRNIVALHILCKCGAVPYILDAQQATETSVADVILGYDLTPVEIDGSVRIACLTVIMDPQVKDVITPPVIELMPGEAWKNVGSKIEKQVIRKYKLSGKTLMIHRDGRVTEDEKESIIDRIGTNHYIVAIKKQAPHMGKLALQKNAKIISAPRKGSCLLFEKEQKCILITTSAWEPEEATLIGTPRPIEVEVVHPTSLDLETLIKVAKQVFFLSEIYIGMPYRGIRLPVSTYYPDKLGSVLRALRAIYCPLKLSKVRWYI